jgi:hypothetical protein
VGGWPTESRRWQQLAGSRQHSRGCVAGPAQQQQLRHLVCRSSSSSYGTWCAAAAAAVTAPGVPQQQQQWGVPLPLAWPVWPAVSIECLVGTCAWVDGVMTPTLCIPLCYLPFLFLVTYY